MRQGEIHSRSMRTVHYGAQQVATRSVDINYR